MIHMNNILGVGDHFQVLKVLEGTGTFLGWGTISRSYGAYLFCRTNGLNTKANTASNQTSTQAQKASTSSKHSKQAIGNRAYKQ